MIIICNSEDLPATGKHNLMRARIDVDLIVTSGVVTFGRIHWIALHAQIFIAYHAHQK